MTIFGAKALPVTLLCNRLEAACDDGAIGGAAFAPRGPSHALRLGIAYVPQVIRVIEPSSVADTLPREQVRAARIMLAATGTAPHDRETPTARVP